MNWSQPITSPDARSTAQTPHALVESLVHGRSHKTNGRASASYQGASVILNTGITINCPAGGATCKSSVSGHTLVPATLARVRKKQLKIGSETVITHAGHHQQIHLKLNRKANRALKKLGKLRITITIKDTDASTHVSAQKTITIRQPKKRHHG